ncbi:MAG: DUF4293 domain-containing protein [Bacteroidales bacterium]
MLQRIQTLFLLAAVLLEGLLFKFRFLHGISTENGECCLRATEMPTIILQTIVFLVSLISIGLYKRRVLQIRLCVFNTVALVGYQFYVLWAACQVSKTALLLDYKITIVFPIIAAICSFLALRFIARDEAMIRSLNRIR